MSKVVFLNYNRRRAQSPDDVSAKPAAFVSVIMVSYFTGPVLNDAITAVLEQDMDLELIIVDNGNPPDLVETYRRRASVDSRIRLISGHGNIGYAAACNLGASAAEGTHLLLLNPDCILPPDAIADMLKAVEPFGRPWVAGCRILNPDGTDQRGSRRELPTPWLMMVEVLQLHRFAPNHPYFKRLNNHHAPVPESVSAVPAISGAFMLITRADYHVIGGMDAGYFLHVEDLDFCFTMTRQGGTVLFVPHVAVMHHRSTSRVSRLFIEWHKAKGFTRYFRKNFSGLYPSMFLRIVNILIWGYFILSVAGMMRTALARLLPAWGRGQRVFDEAESREKSGPKGRAA